MAEGYQARGEIATKDLGRPLSVPSRNTSSPTTLTDLGIKAKQLNETRKLAPVDDAEVAGLVSP